MKAPTLNYQWPVTLSRYGGERFSVLWQGNAACRKLPLPALTREITNACFFSVSRRNKRLSNPPPPSPPHHHLTDLRPFQGGRSLHADTVCFMRRKLLPSPAKAAPPRGVLTGLLVRRLQSLRLATSNGPSTGRLRQAHVARVADAPFRAF